MSTKRMETPVTPLVASARNLCRKLRVIHEDETYQAVWTMASMNGIDYTDDPKYDTELATLEKLLENFPE